jgi:hypothetical protein
MDTGCGFAGQFLVGAGIQQTIAYLEINGNREIVDSIKKLEDARERSDSAEWERAKIGYFYPERANR